MSEIFTITVDNEELEITEDNHSVAMFRETPQYDYLVIRPETDPVEEQRNILVFRHQWLCHWMGNLALNDEDAQILAERTQELGSFKERFGFNSKVLLEDKANSFEEEYFTQGLLNDLGDTLPEGWEC